MTRWLGQSSSWGAVAPGGRTGCGNHWQRRALLDVRMDSAIWERCELEGGTVCTGINTRPGLPRQQIQYSLDTKQTVGSGAEVHASRTLSCLPVCCDFSGRGT